MPIQVLKRPYTRNWSGNPIHYSLFSPEAEADTKVFFEIRIRFKRTDQAAYSDVFTFAHKPTSGTAKVDIEWILNSLLEYELPYLPADNEFQSPYNSRKMTGLFYIQFRQITPDDPDPDFDDSEFPDHQLLVVKGGISWDQWRGDNYWNNYFDPVKPFLTWEESGRLHSLTERMYLAWLNLTDVAVGDIKMKRKVVFTDGSEDIAYLNCPVPLNNVVYFPSGGQQLKLLDIDPTKTIHYWELQVVDYSTNPMDLLSSAHRYEVDNRNDYNAITLNYRNSLGGINSARIRGVIENNVEYVYTETARISLHDYFIEHFVNGKVVIDNSTELLIYKGDISHLGKEEQDRMRDIHLKRETWWEIKKKWMPVVMITQSGKLRASTDKLFPFPVVFAMASGGESSYTPRNVNLHEANASTGLACNAIIGNLQSNYIPGTGWAISWDLVFGNPVKYYISTPGVSGGAPHESIATNYTFPWLPVGDNIITVQPVCMIGGTHYLGAAQTLIVTVAASCVNVSITGAPVFLPDAIIGVPYFYSINLSGTAPFTLSGIVKPAWINIAVVGSTIELTGTPGGGDAGISIDVSFTIENCAAAGSVNFADTIDVIAASGNGDFIVSNNIIGDSHIKLVNTGGAPFYTIISGSFPVNSSQQILGKLTQDVPNPISVKVFILSAVVISLELWKNGVLIETIYTPATGIYSFTATAFLLTDDMEIKMVSI